MTAPAPRMMEGSATPLRGKTAVVTGGGRGIGAAIARTLSATGVAIVVAARTPAEIERVASQLRAEGRPAWPLVCDVSDLESVGEMARSAGRHLGRIDILVNSAGIAHSAPLPKLTLDDWNRLLAVNATGTFLCTQAFLPGMLERGWGRVVNVASVAGLIGGRYIAGYAASKHAVVGFTRCVAAEVEGSGVTVNAVCPGYVDSTMTEDSIDRIVDRTGLSREQALQALLETSSQARLIQPEEVAEMVLSLCHVSADSVNGQAIVLDNEDSRA